MAGIDPDATLRMDRMEGKEKKKKYYMMMDAILSPCSTSPPPRSCPKQQIRKRKKINPQPGLAVELGPVNQC